ncbi:MAG TPA: hypothetical protein VGM43_23540, partial [Bryobacteraceae bacterium]
FLHGIEAWRRPSFATARLLRNVDLFLTNSDFTWARFLEFHPEMTGARIEPCIWVWARLSSERPRRLVILHRRS